MPRLSEDVLGALALLEDAATGVRCRALPVELHDIETTVVIGGVDEASGIDENVGGLNHPCTIGAVVHHACRCRWYERADLLRPVWIANVEHADPGILIRGKDQLGAHETSGPVLMDVVRA